MAKNKSKGVILKQTIASTLTAVAQCTSMGFTGAESGTFDSTTLDNADAFKTYALTGYTEPGSFEFELFFDVGLAGHQALTDLLTTPANCDWQVTHTNSGTTTQDFTGTGMTFDGPTYDMEDGVKANLSIKITGDPGYAT